MFKLTEAGDLEKAAKGLAGFFGAQAQDLDKSHSFHKAVGDHHMAMCKAHGEQGAVCKAHADGLDDGHEMKAPLTSQSEFHKAMATHHENVAKAFHAHAEAMKTQVDALKILASDWGGPAVTVQKAAVAAAGAGGERTIQIPGDATIDQRIQYVTDQLMNKAMEMVETNPEVADKLQNIVLQRMSQVLGDKVVPDQVRGAIPNNPRLTAVPRTGAPQELVNKRDVPLEFEQFLKIEE